MKWPCGGCLLRHRSGGLHDFEQMGGACDFLLHSLLADGRLKSPKIARRAKLFQRLLRLRMEISIHSLLEGATPATGTMAVIDVFRAFTTAAVALANGASKIVMVRTVDEALALRENGIGQICMGEVRGRAPDGSNFGNSPFEISGVDFDGKTIIQRTSAGTQGIVAANRAERLYAASLVTAEGTVRALLSGSPDQISLVAMGENGLKRTDEDELCAIHLRNRLEGRPGDADAIRRLILAGGEVGRFHDGCRSRPIQFPASTRLDR
jgi:2-phosphosulfolactate phosphatase